MNRMDRLFGITLLLQTRSRVTAKELADLFEVSERTIYRDMSALSEVGVPLVSLPGEGYELVPGFNLPPVLLSGGEAAALFLSGRLMMRYAVGTLATDLELALQKVWAVLPDDTRAHVERKAGLIDFMVTHEQMDLDDPNLLALLDAINQRKVVHLIYQGYMADTVTERDVEPDRLTFSDGAWYLNGYCRLRLDMRSFRLNRIQSLHIVPETFTKRIVFPEKVNKQTVTVRFASNIVRHVIEAQHYSFVRLIETTTESDVTMEYQVDNLQEIGSWLLGWGAQAEVLSPDELREWLKDEAKKLIQLLT